MHMSCTYELLCIKKSKHKEQYFVKLMKICQIIGKFILDSSLGIFWAILR